MLAGLFFAALAAAPAALAAPPDDIDEFVAKATANVHIVKRAINADGAIVSCVDRNKQPASNHPSWKGAPEEPSEDLKALLGGKLVPTRQGQTCPAGSVEMDLPTRARIVAAGGLQRYLNKPPPARRTDVPDPAYPGAVKNGWGYSYHAAVQEYATSVIGAQTTVNVWNPVVTNRDFSLTQLWVLGKWGTSSYQSIEAGYQVFPAVYGNSKPNFFVFWKQDWSKLDSPSCQNVCGQWSFVKTSDVLPIGLPVSSTSIAGGTQIEKTIAWYRDPTNGNWYLMVKNPDGTYAAAGYYPAAYFAGGQLSRFADRVDFGGEILQEGSDTTIPVVLMGSKAGRHPYFTDTPYGNVSYQRDIQVMTPAGAVRDLIPNNRAMWPPENALGYPVGCAYGFKEAGRSAPFLPGWGYSIFFGGDGIGGTQGC